MKFAFAIMAVLCLFSSAAEARHGHPHHGHDLVAGHSQHFVRHHGGIHREVALNRGGDGAVAHAHYSTSRGRPPKAAVAGHDYRPSAWCGWQMRQWKGGGPELNLARNWARVGTPSGPQIGAVVVWPHHVGIIVGKAGSGRWIVRSGNDGHQVRERERSVAGAIAFRIVERV